MLAKEAKGRQLWGWLGSEVVGLATRGREAMREGCFVSGWKRPRRKRGLTESDLQLLRLLEEDLSEPFSAGLYLNTHGINNPLELTSPRVARVSSFRLRLG